jgi:adenylate kinase family enzyme
MRTFGKSCCLARLSTAKLTKSSLSAQNTPLTLIINLSVADSVILSRIEDRWVHIPSGRVYNLSFNPPKVPGRDDVTGEPLAKRPDDNPEIFARRLGTYYKSTAPLMEYYTERATQEEDGKLRMVTLTGETSDEIWPNLERTICTLFPSVSLRERTEALRRTSMSSLSDPFPVRPRRTTMGESEKKVAESVAAGIIAK